MGHKSCGPIGAIHVCCYLLPWWPYMGSVKHHCLPGNIPVLLSLPHNKFLIWSRNCMKKSATEVLNVRPCSHHLSFLCKSGIQWTFVTRVANSLFPSCCFQPSVHLQNILGTIIKVSRLFTKADWYINIDPHSKSLF